MTTINKGARPAPPQRRAVSRAAASPASSLIALSVLTGEVAPAKPFSAPDPKDGPPCHLCTARCCKYFALSIDTPVTPQDHDHNRWFLMHAHVVLWRQDGDWYLEVRTPCKHLQPDNACGIYQSRPQVCRDYGFPEKAEDASVPCEFFADDAAYDLFFDSAEAYAAWAKTEIEKRETRLARRRLRRRERLAADRSRQAIA